jgi:hypothetical protein
MTEQWKEKFEESINSMTALGHYLEARTAELADKLYHKLNEIEHKANLLEVSKDDTGRSERLNAYENYRAGYKYWSSPVHDDLDEVAEKHCRAAFEAYLMEVSKDDAGRGDVRYGDFRGGYRCWRDGEWDWSNDDEQKCRGKFEEHLRTRK